jgi:hypothetical protein
MSAGGPRRRRTPPLRRPASRPLLLAQAAAAEGLDGRLVHPVLEDGDAPGLEQVGGEGESRQPGARRACSLTPEHCAMYRSRCSEATTMCPATMTMCAPRVGYGLAAGADLPRVLDSSVLTGGRRARPVAERHAGQHDRSTAFGRQSQPRPDDY